MPHVNKKDVSILVNVTTYDFIQKVENKSSRLFFLTYDQKSLVELVFSSHKFYFLVNDL